jgi:hypothetical protein
MDAAGLADDVDSKASEEQRERNGQEGGRDVLRHVGSPPRSSMVPLPQRKVSRVDFPPVPWQSAADVNPLAPGMRRSEAPGVNPQDPSIHGPTGKPSQAEGEDPDRPAQEAPQPAEGHPSQAEGEDPDD